MATMESFMAVQDGTQGIIGKLFYYSVSNILIEKGKLIETGNAFGLPKVKPARESKASAYRYATTALRDRVAVKDAAGTHIYRVYCRDNKQDTATTVCRELVKETLDETTNDYKKLANILFDKENEVLYCDNEQYDGDVDVGGYCRQAAELFERFKNCYNSDHVDSVIQEQLDRMQANKISIHGNLYFVPSPNLTLLNILEDYISAISECNLNSGLVMSNSMFVVDDERQRQKMTEEFYANYKREIEGYQERIQHFIDNGCTSKAVIGRWLQKIQSLQQKKKTYEEVLKRQLDNLDRDYAMLQMQSEELFVRNSDAQMTIDQAA